MISHGVEISIARGVVAMVRDLYFWPFIYFYFFYIMYYLLRYKNMHAS